jgi:hypothetical protein
MTNIKRRLEFSRAGFIRRVSMSKDALFVIVEGKVADSYFAERLCRSSSAISDAGYQIHLISQIREFGEAGTGGKEAIISFYEYCSHAGRLNQQNSIGRKHLAFIVDRDAQNLTGGVRRSRHIIYTYYADAEAHIFAESDEVESLALAASLDSATARNLLAYLGDWREDLARAWRPWIELCCLAGAARSRTWVGFGKAESLIHDGHMHRALDSEKFDRAVQAVQDTSLFRGEEFDSIRKNLLEKIEEIYQRSDGASLLKGKWLPGQLAMLVKEYFSDSNDWDETGFRESVRRCYGANLLFNGPGAKQMHNKLESLLSS